MITAAPEDCSPDPSSTEPVTSELAGPEVAESKTTAPEFAISPLEALLAGDLVPHAARQSRAEQEGEPEPYLAPKPSLWPLIRLEASKRQRLLEVLLEQVGIIQDVQALTGRRRAEHERVALPVGGASGHEMIELDASQILLGLTGVQLSGETGHSDDEVVQASFVLEDAQDVRDLPEHTGMISHAMLGLLGIHLLGQGLDALPPIQQEAARTRREAMTQALQVAGRLDPSRSVGMLGAMTAQTQARLLSWPPATAEERNSEGQRNPVPWVVRAPKGARPLSLGGETLVETHINMELISGTQSEETLIRIWERVRHLGLALQASQITSGGPNYTDRVAHAILNAPLSTDPQQGRQSQHGLWKMIAEGAVLKMLEASPQMTKKALGKRVSTSVKRQLIRGGSRLSQSLLSASERALFALSPRELAELGWLRNSPLEEEQRRGNQAHHVLSYKPVVTLEDFAGAAAYGRARPPYTMERAEVAARQPESERLADFGRAQQVTESRLRSVMMGLGLSRASALSADQLAQGQAVSREDWQAARVGAERLGVRLRDVSANMWASPYPTGLSAEQARVPPPRLRPQHWKSPQELSREAALSALKIALDTASLLRESLGHLGFSPEQQAQLRRQGPWEELARRTLAARTKARRDARTERRQAHKLRAQE